MKLHQTLSTAHIYPDTAQRATLPLSAPQLTIPSMICKGRAPSTQQYVCQPVPGAKLLAEPRGQGIPQRPGRACTNTLRYALHCISATQHHTLYNIIRRPFTASGGSANCRLTLPVPLLISYILRVSGSYCTALFQSLAVPKWRSGTGTTFLSVCICTFS